MYSVYFLKSLSNGKVYAGFSSKDPKDRLAEHNRGSNTWTRSNGPFKLLYYEMYDCEKDARKRELFYKTGIGKRIKKAIVTEMEKAGVAQW